jgi:hypothetical protein
VRILWVLSVDPTRRPDGQISYSLALIRAVAAAGAEITVAHLGSQSPSETNGSITWRAAGTANRNRLGSLVSRLPAMAYTAGSSAFVETVEDALAGSWDAIVVDHVQSGWALPQLAARRGPALLVHVSHNDEQAVRSRVATGTAKNFASRLALELDARKVAALEERILGAVGLVTTITAEDAASFSARHPGLRVEVLSPGYRGSRVAHREITAAVPRRAVIAGSMLWRVKQFDLLELLRVADARFAAAGAEITVVGEAPPEFEAEVRRSTSATTMAGRVDSFEDAFAQARLALLSEPHGGGFKLKSLDYVFHRVPMLVQAGSVTGLPLADGQGLLEFPGMEELVGGALAVMDDFEQLNRLQNSAYDYCDTAFDWAERGDRFCAALRDAG